MRHLRRLPLLALIGCSLGTYDYVPCEANKQCRDAFGFNNVCNPEGFCQQAEANDRCTETWPEDLLERPENYETTIILGSLYDHSTDTPETLATQLPIIQVNTSEGLDGQFFGIVQCDYAEDLDIDDQTADEATESGALYLADTIGVASIIGPATSSQAQTAYSALHYGAADFDVVLISPSATSTSLTSIDGVAPTEEDPGLFWRTAPPDDLQGKVIADLVTEQGLSDVICIHESGPYGQGLYEAFDLNYAGNAEEITYTEQATISDYVVSGTAGKDAVLFFASDASDIAAFLNAAVGLAQFEDMPIFFADAARDTDLLDAASSASDLFDNVTGTAPAIVLGDVYDAFNSAYAAEYAPSSASDSVYTPYCYDATWLAIYGTAWSYYQDGGVGGTGIARGLRHISDPDWEEEDQIILRLTSWIELVAYADAGEDINVIGASGELEYDPETGETSGPVDVWKINEDGDGFDTVNTVEP